MLLHHFADVLRFKHFQLRTKRQEKRNQFVVRYHINGNTKLLVVVMLRGMERFILDIRISIRRHAHDDMLHFALRDGNTHHIIKILVEIQSCGLGFVFATCATPLRCGQGQSS